MLPSSVNIRPATASDIPELLALMKALAEFEGYSDQFAVTEEAVHERLIEHQSIQILVADTHDQLAGMLVSYELPFTYDLSPWLYIKELYVCPKFREQGVANALFKNLACLGNERGVSKIRWDVLKTNIKAQKFYQSQGAQHDASWQLYSLSTTEISNLAQFKN